MRMDRLRIWARRMKTDVHAVWLAARDPRTPLPTRILGMAIAAYALSPIDLIPDFVPVLGLLDDVILIPFGIWLFVRLIPAKILAEHRATAEAGSQRPVSRTGAAVILLIWLVAAAMLALHLYGWSRW
jgi:uncharacterized membrane protein YkvA (DUF1232 family)